MPSSDKLDRSVVKHKEKQHDHHASEGRQGRAPVKSMPVSIAMRLILVSGLSGSGKSVALHMLEDLDYYCVDNIPAALLKSFVSHTLRSTRRPVPAHGGRARCAQHAAPRSPPCRRCCRS